MTTIGNYRILKQIGEGGFGRVYQAEHVILGENACVKQNKNASRADADLLQHEAKILWELYEYHSIPSVKDFIRVDEETGFLITSYIDGKTLEDIVAKKGAIHPEDCCWITERLLGALHYAHYNGVVHSDVKPENVFIEPGKRDIKLIDFGLATYKPKSGTKALGYTPKYAAPELMLGQPPIPESDIYGAGIVMLRALGGNVLKKSFRADTPGEIVQYCQNLLKYDWKERPNWEKGNLLQELSDVREKVFGRRHIDDKTIKKLKGGGT